MHGPHDVIQGRELPGRDGAGGNTSKLLGQPWQQQKTAFPAGRRREKLPLRRGKRNLGCCCQMKPLVRGEEPPFSSGERTFPPSAPQKRGLKRALRRLGGLGAQHWSHKGAGSGTPGLQTHLIQREGCRSDQPKFLTSLRQPIKYLTGCHRQLH